MEKEQMSFQIQSLEKEILCLSGCSLAKEKENLRKDLEKRKVKLKETEFKLKNAIQEKTKLEGEKAFAEREVKRLHGQNSHLERGINKHDSLAGRRGDSISNKNLKEEYRKLEVLGFEMEATIASLEEEVVATQKEKEEALSANAISTSELETLSGNFNLSNAELNVLLEEVSGLREQLEESKINQQAMDNSMKLLLAEKEELAMQLTNSLLEMEEEKAIWTTKEKASLEAIEEKTKSYDVETTSMSKVVLEKLQSQLLDMMKERDLLMAKIEGYQIHVSDVEFIRKHCDDVLVGAKAHIEELNARISSMEANMQNDEVNNSKEKVKLRMRLRGTQASLDAVRFRYMEVINELDVMNREYKEATGKLKERLASYAKEVLNLKKHSR